MGFHFVGWLLDPDERTSLLRHFPPAYPDVIAHHVTLAVGAAARIGKPRDRQGDMIGHVDDGAGLEAFVLRIGGRTERPGGGLYHITWSLDRSRGRRPVDSNAVLDQRGFHVLDVPIGIRLIPIDRLPEATRKLLPAS